MNRIAVAQELLKLARELAGADEQGFTTVMLGGSVGENRARNVRDLAGQPISPEYHKVFPSVEEAKAKAKRQNSILSPGEKKYYGLKYVVAEVSGGKFTGN